MKVFGYLDDVLVLMQGLEWYWQWSIAIGTILIFYGILSRFICTRSDP